MSREFVRLPADAFYTLRGTMGNPNHRTIVVLTGIDTQDKANQHRFTNYWDAYDFVAEKVGTVPLLAWAE